LGQYFLNEKDQSTTSSLESQSSTV
jgi:hypothetical protein